jgi:hypothetical protein
MNKFQALLSRYLISTYFINTEIFMNRTNEAIRSIMYTHVGKYHIDENGGQRVKF